MNRIEAFTALMSGQKVQPSNWKAAGWYLELGGVGPSVGDPPDQVMFVTATTKQPYTHWPDINYELFEVKIPVTGTQLGNALTQEAQKLSLPANQISSLVSGVKSSLGF